MNTSSGPSLRSTTCFVLGIAFATLSGVASAQSYYRRDLMDYDQKRNALAKDGSMFCVPTAYVDIFRFMAVKGGFGNLDKGYNNGYASITDFINRMANIMDTDKDDGTNFDDGVEGAAEWIADHSNQFFVHCTFGPTNNWGTQRLRHTAAMGWMARIGYSRFYKDGSTWERKGGHALALAGYDYRTSSKKILVANPATDDGNINVQGAFQIDSHDVENVSINTDDYGQVSHARWSKWTKDGVQWQAMIDKMHVIIPAWVGWVNAPHTTTPPNNLYASIAEGYAEIAPTTFHAVFPGATDDGVNPVIRERDIELPGPVKDWCMDPGQAAIYVLLTDGTVHHVDLLDKTIDKVTTIRGGRKLAVAGKGFDLFVLQDGNTEDNLVRIEQESKRQISMKVAKGITAIEPDPETKGIAALHPTSKRLFRVDPDLKQARPLTIDLPEGEGAVFMGMGRKGDITFARSGAKTFTRAIKGAAMRRVSMAQSPKTLSFQPLSKNLFIVQDGEKLMTVDADGKPSSSPFDKIKATGIVRLSHGWSPYSKADFTGEKWNNIFPGKEEL